MNPMSKPEARAILDAAKRGELLTSAVITDALVVTGDLARYEQPVIDCTSALRGVGVTA